MAGARLNCWRNPSIPQSPDRSALDLFDRLRLREPFAQAFNALGFEGEEGWRVAARIKVVLLSGAGVGEPEAEIEVQEPAVAPKVPAGTEGSGQPTVQIPGKEMKTPTELPAGEVAPLEKKAAIAPNLWLDSDVRWLTGVHEAGGHEYVVREPYEELLWWLMMPSLLRLAGEPVPSRSAAKEIATTVQNALTAAAAAKYRVDILMNGDEGDSVDREETEAHKADSAPLVKAGTKAEPLEKTAEIHSNPSGKTQD